MKPAPFDYVRADSVGHAVTQLAAASADGEGKIIAGGQSLMPLLALRLALGGVAATPVRSAAAEGVLASGLLDTMRIGEAAEAAAGEIEPASDIHASAGYRRQLTRVLVTRALTRAAGAQAAEEKNPCR